MKINVTHKQIALSIDSIQVRRLVKAVLVLEKQTCDEVGIHFIDIKAICTLHDQYFQDPSATDCISFPMDATDQQGYKVLGEVFICPQVGISYTVEHGGDPYWETSLYVVHGLLHLLGYDDLDAKDRSKMRRAEKKHMQHLEATGKLLVKVEGKK